MAMSLIQGLGQRGGHKVVLGEPGGITGGEGTIYVRANWAARPATANDGDYLHLTNTEATFRWWSGSAGLWDGSGWIRAEIYGRTPVLDKYLTGTVLPAAEGWTENVGGGGTITSDGTRVRLKGDIAAADLAYISYTHGQTMMWFAADVQATFHDANSGLSPDVLITQGAFRVNLMLLGNNSSPIAFFSDNSGSFVGGEQERDEDLLTAERMIEIIMSDPVNPAGTAATVDFYADGRGMPASAKARQSIFPADATNRILIGDLTGGVRSNMYIRRALLGHYTTE